MTAHDTATTIWKFPLTNEAVEMPKGARLLTVQTQNGIPCLWAEVNPKAEKVTRHLLVVGTGWDDGLVEGSTYLATFQQGPLVFHVYDMGEES